MKHIFLIIFFSWLFSLNGMDNDNCVCVLSCNKDSSWKHSFLKYSKIHFYGTQISVAKGNVCKADGVVDVIVGHENALHNKRVEISAGVIVNSLYRYGRYACNYVHGYHMEGVICSPVPSISDDLQSCKIIDVERDSQVVKKILGFEYTNILGDIKTQFPEAERIAISSLATEIGFPTKMTIPLAVKAICKFIKNDPKAYSEIFLFVKTQSLVDQYIKMFEKYIDYCASFD